MAGEVERLIKARAEMASPMMRPQRPIEQLRQIYQAERSHENLQEMNRLERAYREERAFTGGQSGPPLEEIFAEAVGPHPMLFNHRYSGMPPNYPAFDSPMLRPEPPEPEEFRAFPLAPERRALPRRDYAPQRRAPIRLPTTRRRTQ